MNFKYDNITITGGVAVGKNTLFNNLMNYLKPGGWKFRTTGQILRDKTNENVNPTASLVNNDFHRKIEDEAYRILKDEKHWVIEGWLAGFIARDLKRVLKVILFCSNNSILVDRVTNRDKVSVTKAKKLLQYRQIDNFNTWKKIYGDYDFFNRKFFDIAIDTYSSGQMETVNIVLNKLGFNK